MTMLDTANGIIKVTGIMVFIGMVLLVGFWIDGTSIEADNGEFKCGGTSYDRNNCNEIINRLERIENKIDG